MSGDCRLRSERGRTSNDRAGSLRRVRGMLCGQRRTGQAIEKSAACDCTCVMVLSFPQRLGSADAKMIAPSLLAEQLSELPPGRQRYSRADQFEMRTQVSRGGKARPISISPRRRALLLPLDVDDLNRKKYRSFRANRQNGNLRFERIASCQASRSAATFLSNNGDVIWIL